MSADPDRSAACPIDDKVTSFAEGEPSLQDQKIKRSVRFPDENQLVTEYFEPANPWRDVPTTTRAQLAQDYLLSCRRHNTAPIDSVLQQIRELPEQSIGGATRAARLVLADCSLESAAPADALESVLRKVQFRRIELDHSEIDDEGAEALFDMIEYYESACVISIAGPRQFGIRGWQAASRMIKKSAELSEIELAESDLEPSHAPVLARALRPHTCRLRALCLQRAKLSGEALMCLVIALKSNGSIRELRLPDNSLTPHDAQQLGSLLRFNTNIQLLDLSNNQIQDMGVGHIADALQEQAAQTPPSTATSPISPHLYPMSGVDAKGLAFLVLWNNQLTRNCAQHLMRALRSSHSLCVLNVGRNALGTDAVRALQSGASHGALLSLGLQCARLGPEAGAPLAQLLMTHVKLQRLDLRDNRLGPVGLQALLNAMKENHTLTQIDLDDPAESTTLTAEDSDAACVARLTRDIRALCRRNEPPATEADRRVHRKISLTCHTACVLKSSPVRACRRTARLRSPLPSPAPSPAGSPTPHQNIQHNRFSVTRVTPERESSTESCSPTTPTRPYCSTPSRFKVMQVTEPPSIQVHPAQKRSVSRFSVTRNYDAAYNPSPRESPSASPTPSTNSPSPSVSPCPSDNSYSDSPRGDIDSPRSEKSYSDSPRDENVSLREENVTPRGKQGSDSSRSGNESLSDEKSYSDSPRGERTYRDTPRPEKSHRTETEVSRVGYPDNKTVTEKHGIDSTSPSYDKVPSRLAGDVPTTTIFSSSATSISSTDTSREYYYSSPSITTLSGALFSRSEPERSTTTICPRQSCLKTGTPFGVTQVSNMTFGLPNAPKVSNQNINIPITSSHSEPVFGPALFVESSIPPTAVPNSRFSISPSPVSFIYAVESFYTKPQDKDLENIRQDCTKIDSIRTKIDNSSIKIDNSSTKIDSYDAKMDSSSTKSDSTITGTKGDSLSTITDTSRTKLDESNTKIDSSSTNKHEPSTYIDTSSIKIDSLNTKTDDCISKINNSSAELDLNAIKEKIGDSNRSHKETSLCRDIFDEKVQPVVTCDMKSASTDVSSYTGETVPSGIEIIQIRETDLIKQDVTMTETIKIPDELLEEMEQKRCEIVDIPEDKNIGVKTSKVNESQSKKDVLEKHVGIEIQKVPERLDQLVSKYIEKAQKVPKTIERDEFDKVSSETKAVEFASEPEEVIFFISDEPISFNDKVISDDKIAGKTYSDVVKTDFKDKLEQISYEKNLVDDVVKTETKLVKNSVEISDSEKVDVKVAVTVKTESVKDNAAKVHSDKDFNIDDIIIRKDDKTMTKIEAITEDLGNLIHDMRVMSSNRKCTVDVGSLNTNIVPGSFNRDVVLKKNKSESSLDSPDLEVSRLMNKKLVGSPFRDSSSSLEISGSSMESLNAIENVPKPIIIQESVDNDTELDRRKEALSTESSVESTSEVTPVNSQNFLTTSVSSNESVSPILFGKTKKIHGSLSSLEASMSSLDSKQDKIMVTSADSGIEHSLQNPSDSKDDASSNEGTLTHNSSLKESVKRTESLQETLTDSPKRTSSLLDVPALKSKGLDRMRKISWVAPSSSFHIPREAEKVKEEKPSHLEKLLSLFQHPTSLFSRSVSEEEKKSASNTPPRKDSSATSFWPWGNPLESKEEKEDSSEATDSTLSERVQVSFVDESFSKKLDSKTPSTDTDNTLSEFQSFSQNIEEKVTDNTTDVLVQKCLDLSLADGSETTHPRPSDTIDLKKPNDNRNETEPNDAPVETHENIVKLEEKDVQARPRSFAAVLKASGSENTLDKQPSPETGPLVDKLPFKVIRGIKENISPENTLTSSVTNTRALAVEMKHQPSLLDKSEPKTDDAKTDLAPIATIEETCDITADNFSSETIQLAFIDDVKIDIAVRSNEEITQDKVDTITKELDAVDLGKDALSYLMYEALGHLEPERDLAKVEQGSLAQELKEAAIKEMSDRSPDLVVDEAILVYSEPKPGTSQKLKKSNSLEDLIQRQEIEKSPKAKSIAFKMPETSPRDIPERRSKLRSRSGSSPKSLPESLNKPCPLAKMDLVISKKKKKVSSLGKMARDSLLALNMSEDEMAEFRRSYKLTSVESLRSLESVSEDANSQSGASVDSRCRSCLRTSQESLMSLDSIIDECKCHIHGIEKRVP